MNSEIKVTGSKTKVYLTLGTSLTAAMVLSMLIFPDVWRVAVYAGLGVAVLVSAGLLTRAALLTHHELAMLAIERDKARFEARLVQVAQTNSLYDARAGLVLVNPTAGLLPAPKAEPPVQRWEVYTEHTDRETNSIQLLNLSLPPQALQRFAGAIGRGDSFSERAATGAGLTQQQFYDIRDELLSRNMAVWKHPHRRQQGVELTPSAKALFRGIAASPLPR